MRTRLLASLIVICIISMFALLVYAATSYRINSGQYSYSGWEHSNCKKVNNTGSLDLFVPTKTSSEWTSFVSNPPADVDVTDAWCCNSATDDSYCGTIDCSGYYVQTGTESATTTESCYNKLDISTNRCEGQDDCLDANTSDCSSQGNDAVQYTCGTCKYISASDCTGTTLGSCSNYASGTSCGSGLECDGSGNCVSASPTFSGSGSCVSEAQRIEGTVNQLKFFTDYTGSGLCAVINITGTTFSYSFNGGAYQSNGTLSRQSGIIGAFLTDPSTFTFQTAIGDTLSIQASGGVTFTFDGYVDDNYPIPIVGLSSSGNELTIEFAFGTAPDGGTTHWTMS